jgi:hypothetical protein
VTTGAVSVGGAEAGVAAGAVSAAGVESGAVVGAGAVWATAIEASDRAQAMISDVVFMMSLRFPLLSTYPAPLALKFIDGELSGRVSGAPRRQQFLAPAWP